MAINLAKDYSKNTVKNSDEVGTTSSLQELLEENLKLAKETNKMVKKIRHYVFWATIWGWIKILIIVVPIVLAVIYVPKFFNEFKNNPERILENSWVAPIMESIMGSAATQIDLDSIDAKNLPTGVKLPTDIKKYIK